MSSSGASPAASRDVFLSYHSPDRPAVLRVRSILEGRGISTFFDRENLVPGLPWDKELTEALRGARAVVIFVGAMEGPYQAIETSLAFRRQAANRTNFQVIPVLL